MKIQFTNQNTVNKYDQSIVNKNVFSDINF